jgi:hypothetical protein
MGKEKKLLYYAYTLSAIPDFLEFSTMRMFGLWLFAVSLT